VWLTSEEMVLQAALGHVLHQQDLLVLPAVPQQPHQTGMILMTCKASAVRDITN